MRARVSIRPSALGSKGLLLFASLEFSFLATNYSNLFFLLLAFSSVLGVFGMLWCRSQLLDLRLEKLSIDAAPAGSPRVVQVRLAGKRKLHFDLHLEIPLANRYVEIGHATCLANNGIIEGSLPGQSRSAIPIDHLRITSRFPFGFYVARLKIPVEQVIVTYPKLISTPLRLRTRGGMGGEGALKSGRGTLLSGLREFRTGDALKDVHWKATARRGTAIIKERESEAKPTLEIALDRRCSKQALEQALGQIAALVIDVPRGSPLRLRSQDFEAYVKPVQGDISETLRWLAETEQLEADASAPASSTDAIHFPIQQGGRE
jgi:uncharacterized protein (DUF58 family)